jgi:N-acetylmuramoyl-L-alanine amidase
MVAASAEAQIRSRWVMGQKYLSLHDIAAYYGATVRIEKTYCEMSSRYSKVRFVFDRRDGILNGVNVHYHFAPVLQNGVPLVSEFDFQTIVEPVLRPASLRPHPVGTIMLDPGHGTPDNGASGALFHEKDLVLSISRRVKSYLEAHGFRVIMTRSSDYFLTLEQRANLCKRNKVDLFVSIHCNSAANSSASGIETYALTPFGAPSTSEKKPSMQKNVGQAMPRNNYRLAYEVQKCLIARTGAVDRGVRHARFYVLKEASCPSILIEAGFLSNRSEERKLGNVGYQDSVARAIAEGVARYRTLMKSAQGK